MHANNTFTWRRSKEFFVFFDQVIISFFFFVSFLVVVCWAGKKLEITRGLDLKVSTFNYSVGLQV